MNYDGFAMRHRAERGNVLDASTATKEQCETALNVLFSEARQAQGRFCSAQIVLGGGKAGMDVCLHQAKGVRMPAAFIFFLGGLAAHLDDRAVKTDLDSPDPKMQVRTVRELACAINEMAKKHQIGTVNRVADNVRAALGESQAHGRR